MFAELLVILVLIYAALGIAFAIAFVTLGVARVDEAARGAPLGFRLLILPGTAALWPIMLMKWLRARPPETHHAG